MSRSLFSLRSHLAAIALVLALIPAIASAGTGVYGKVSGATSQAPIAGAYVLAAQLDTSKTVVQTRLTGQLGGFEFNTLTAGRWLVVVSASGYQTAYKTAIVAAGQMVSLNFSLTTQAETQAGVIEGTVANLRTGAPLPGATVYYQLEPTSGSAVIMMIHHVITDANGHYRIPGLIAGTYQVSACATGFAGAHKLVAVASGHVSVANFQLEPNVTPLPGAIVGRVVDAKTSAPLAGARVYYGPLYSATADFRWFDTAGTPIRPYVVTDSTGHFKIETLAPGLYYLLATKDGYERQQRQVTVVTGQTTEVKFRLIPVVPQVGSITGVVKSRTGTPIAGATVYYSPYGLVFVTQPRVITNSEGRYTISNIPVGPCPMRVTAAGFLTQETKVNVVANQVLTVNFALYPSTITTGSVFGRVVDAKTSAPLAGVEIHVVPAVATTGTLARYGAGVTNTNGEYRISQIPAGPVVVKAYKIGYANRALNASVPAGGQVRVDFRLWPVAPVQTGKIVGHVLAAANEKPIAGALVRIVPVAVTSAAVTTWPADCPRETLTDANGQYGFERVPVGSYQVIAVKREFRQQSKPAQVTANMTTEVNFLLEALPTFECGKIYGRVVDAVTSTPIASVWVAVEVDAASPLAATPVRLVAYTNLSGYFVIERVPVGDWTIYAAKKGYMPAKQTVHIIKDQTTIVGFRLSPITNRGVIEGNVTDTSTGAMLANVHVVVPLLDQPHMTNPNTALHAITNSSGHYRIEGVPAGERKVIAFNREYIPETGVVTVAAGQTVQLDFALARRQVTQTVTVLVKNAAGAVLSGVKLSVPVCDAIEPFCEWDLFQTMTSSTGMATLRGVPDGLFFLVGSLANYQPAYAMLPDRYEAIGGVSSLTMMLSPMLMSNSVTDWVNYN